MRAVIDDIHTFKTLVRPLRRLSRHATFEFMLSEVRIVSADEDEFCSWHLTLKRAYFNSYKVREPVRLVIDIEPLVRLLESLRDDVRLAVKPLSDSVSFSYRKNNVTHELTIRKDDVSCALPRDSKALCEPIAIVYIPWETFRSVIQQIAAVGDELVWEIQDGSLRARTQKSDYLYTVKLPSMNCVVLPGGVRLARAVPMQFMKNLLMELSPSGPVTLQLFREGLISLAVGQQSKFSIKCFVSARVVSSS